MPAIEAILGRHSTREGFVDRSIDGAILSEIVRCGLAAPSSKNARPWRLHVVTDRDVLRSLASTVQSEPGGQSYVPHDPRTGRPRPEYHSTVVESAHVLAQVPAAIFVENLGLFSGGRATLGAATPEALTSSLVGYTFEIVGVAAAIQNMWVAAHALGVQAAFMGDIVIAEAAIAERLGIEGDLIGVLALGYTDTSGHPRKVPDAMDPSRVVWHPRSCRPSATKTERRVIATF